jgi:hypothetical protein
MIFSTWPGVVLSELPGGSLGWRRATLPEGVGSLGLTFMQ